MSTESPVNADPLRRMVDDLNKRRKLVFLIGGLLLIPVAIMAQFRSEEGSSLDIVLVALLLSALVCLGIAWRMTKKWIVAREQLDRAG